MEHLDIYDENENLIGRAPRSEVHEKGLWHRTTHCWIVRRPSHILFQMRSKQLLDNPGKLYTTASGHVASGEDLKDALKREVSEEVGIHLETEKAVLIHEGKWSGDFIKNDGIEYHDRVFHKIFLLEDNSSMLDYNFQEEELHGLFELPICETLAVLKGELDKVSGCAVFKSDGKPYVEDICVRLQDFLILNHETGYGKFGYLLEKALEYFES